MTAPDPAMGALDRTVTAGATDGSAPRPPGPPAGELAPGSQIDRYTVRRWVGEGGMGIVFAAHDPDLDREVALKLLRRGRGSDGDRTRLIREARAMARLRHANVITVHDVGSDGERDFVAMELVDGGCLVGWRAAAPRSVDEILQVYADAGRGLAAAHAAGLIHRDFKPHNVLIDRDGRVLVTDFGLARSIADPDVRDPDEPDEPRSGDVLASPLTVTGTVLGTPAYMAPEQLAGRPATARSDQFGFSVALWEALTGARPFRGDSLVELRRAVDAGLAADAGADLPPAVAAALRRGLASDPAARWPDLPALLAALAAPTAPTLPTPTPQPPRPRRRLAAASLAAVVLLGGTAAAVLLGGRAGSPDDPAADPAALAATCPGPSSMIDAAWSPARRDALLAALPAGASATRIADALDARRAAWIDAWDAVCAAPATPALAARVACLDDSRRDLAALATVLPTLATDHRADLDVRTLVSGPAACRTAAAETAPPSLADRDAATRAAAATLRDRLAEARIRRRTGGRDQALIAADAAIAEARRLALPDVEAEALLVRASAADGAASAAMLEEAALTADAAGHPRIAAIARVRQLPALQDRSPLDPALDVAIRRARAAVARAGDDPMLRVGLELALASGALLRDDPDAAIRHAEPARRSLETLDEPRIWLSAVRVEAAALSTRRHGDDLARARGLLKDALRVTDAQLAAGVPLADDELRPLASLLWQVGELASAHAVIARLETRDGRPANHDPELRGQRGVVVDEAGRPVAGASVLLAWGHISGDAEALRSFEEPAGSSAMVTTGADGRFVARARRGAKIVAAHGDRRSRIVVGRGGDVTVRLGPTATVTGRTIGAPGGLQLVWASPREALSDERTSSWSILAPVDGDGTFVLAGIPLGRVDIAGINTAAGQRDELHLVHRRVEVTGDLDGVILDLGDRGGPVDVIVRADRDAEVRAAQVFVAPGAIRATTVDELQPALDAPDLWVGNAYRVDDGNASAAGRPHYRDGDIHAGFTAIPAGRYTVCVLPHTGNLADAGYRARLDPHMSGLDVTCQAVTLTGDPAGAAVTVVTRPMRRLP